MDYTVRITRANTKAQKKTTTARPKKTRPAPAEDRFFRAVRVGQRFIGGHFDPAVLRQLKFIAAEDDATVQDLLAEALDLLFVKRGKAKIDQLVGSAEGRK